MNKWFKFLYEILFELTYSVLVLAGIIIFVASALSLPPAPITATPTPPVSAPVIDYTLMLICASSLICLTLVAFLPTKRG
jgi:hypothetical protein